MKVHKAMRRVETMYEMDAEVVVVFLDFHKCQSACNLLVEKLDETVTVNLPEFYHAGTTLETLRFASKPPPPPPPPKTCVFSNWSENFR